MIWMIIGLVLWYAIGVFECIRWWMEEFDFTTEELGFTLVLGFLGPINFLITWQERHKKGEPKIIFKKRK